MVRPSASITLEKVGEIWRVCLAGVCREHAQKWQAEVFYHQMLNNSSECEDGQRGYLNARNL